MLLQTDTDSIEQAIESYNLMSILLVAVVIGVILAFIVSLYDVHKKTDKPMRTIKNFDGYKTAVGTVVGLEEEAYFVKPYVPNPELKIQDDNKKKSDVFSALEKERAEEELREKSKPVEKTRFKAEYTFAAEGLGDGFYGEFYVYEKTEAVSEGKEIQVWYDPERPQVNFTEYSRPI